MSRYLYIAVLFSAISAYADSDRMAHARLRPIVISALVEDVNRLGYALGFDNETMTPRWVAYRLRKEDVTGDRVKREDRFKRDYAVINSPTPYDYHGSGYDRGHIAPANDMKYERERMLESFYMSNMAPQFPHLNRGAWKKLEDFTQKSVKRFSEIYVISGPIYFPWSDNRIDAGESSIRIPDAFFKVLYKRNGAESMLGFIIPNQAAALSDFRVYVRPVLEIEIAAGMHFFPDADPDGKNELRNKCELQLWM